MRPLKRRQMQLSVLMCEKITYTMFEDILGKKAAAILCLWSLYENVGKTFAGVMERLTESKYYLERHLVPDFWVNKPIDEYIEFINGILDMEDKSEPLTSHSHVFQLFAPKFVQDKYNWRFRGHPVLWMAMAREFDQTRIEDINRRKFAATYFNSYEKITGRRLEPGECFYVESLDAGIGGMSAGAVDPEWFLTMYGTVALTFENCKE